MLPNVSSAAFSPSLLLCSSRSAEVSKALLPELAVLAKGLAAEKLPKPLSGLAVLRFELVLGTVDVFDFAEDAKGDAAAEPKEENGLTNGLEVVEVGEAGEYEELGRPKLACTEGELVPELA